MPRIRATSITRLVLGLCVAGPAAAQEQPPEFPSAVELVTVDVVVRDRKGHPVTDLGPADFTLLEDGSPQKITSFEHVSAVVAEDPVPSPPGATASPGAAVSPQGEAATSRSRTYVIVFDQVHLTSLEAARARRALSSFLGGALRQGDRVKLVAVDGWEIEGSAGDVLQELSNLEGRRVPEQGPEALSDYEAMRIDRYDDGPLMLRVMERIAILTAGRRPYDFEAERIRNTTARQLDQKLDEGYIRLLARRVYQDAVRRNETTLATLESVLDDLAALRGRKSVVLCSSALIKDPEAPGFRRVVEASSRANAAVYFVDVRGLEGIPGETAEHGTFVPSIDQGILLTSQALETAGAESLASDTGGFTVKNRNDLADGFRRIAVETRNYYLLGYSPSRGQYDGRFRKIEVKVARKGVEVRARSGYYPVPPDGVTVWSSWTAEPSGVATSALP